jgi:RNA polymerase sigma-70 factor (ECF subfamily)
MANESSQKSAVTQILQRWSMGDKAALEELIPLIFDDLRHLARRRIRDFPADSSMQATALVNEVYLRLVSASEIAWQSRAHFFAIAARLMRQIAVDDARARGRAKRGGDWQRLDIDDSDIPADADNTLLTLDEALDRLATLHQRKARVVELRFFGGMSNAEIAEALAISIDTVKRDWTFAKLWLAREAQL